MPRASESPPDVTLIVTEGNYLLLDEMPWATVRTLLDQCWYVEVPEQLRHERLEARHRRSADLPKRRTSAPTAPTNATPDLIAATATSADAIIQLS